MSKDSNDMEAAWASTKECKWSEKQLEDAKSTKESLSACHSFCAVMAGFGGFIISEYVHSPVNCKWGLFLLALSFIFNLGAATVSFLWGAFLREGVYRDWFRIVARSVILMAMAGVFTFSLGVLLFVETIGVGLPFAFSIDVIVCSFFLFWLGLFFKTAFHLREHPNDSTDAVPVMKVVNV